MAECVIYNPAAGRGRARRLVERLKRLSGPGIDLRPTTEPGHATALARQAVDQGFTTIIAAGGDGTVHEVANGIIGRPGVTFGVWPIGSANDYAYALCVHGDWPLHARGRGSLTVGAVDVGRVTGGGRSAYFVNGLGLGFNGAVTHESRRIHGLRGMPLYGLAFLRALWRHFDSPLMTIEYDGLVHESPTLALSINIGQREGGFLVTPRAELDDGQFDFVHACGMTRWQALTMLARIATGTLPAPHALIRQGRCRAVRVRAVQPLRVHIDGEFFCQPEDGVTEITVELIPVGAAGFARDTEAQARVSASYATRLLAPRAP